jgi:hypothetical protein
VLSTNATAAKLRWILSNALLDALLDARLDARLATAPA